MLRVEVDPPNFAVPCPVYVPLSTHVIRCEYFGSSSLLFKTADSTVDEVIRHG